MFKPIETIYNGYKFRSRVEARWAVFFDELGVEYEYEKEGFDMDGVWYLPDFYLSDYKVWVEIKGDDKEDLSKKEMNKINKFVTENKLWLICGSPDNRKHGIEPNYEIYVSVGHWLEKINKFEYRWRHGDVANVCYLWTDDLGIVDEKITLNDIKEVETINNSLMHQYTQEWLETENDENDEQDWYDEYPEYDEDGLKTIMSIKNTKSFFDIMMDSRCLFGVCSNCHKLSIHPYWALGYGGNVGLRGFDFFSFCNCKKTRWPEYANPALLVAKQARFEFSDYVKNLNK